MRKVSRGAPWQIFRAGWVCGVLALFTLSPGCRRAPAALEFNDLVDKIVAPEGVTIVPDWRWQRFSERGGAFRKIAQLHVWVEGGVDFELLFSLTPAVSGRRAQLEISWDGEPVPDGWRRDADRTIEVEIPKSLLAPGAHRLTMTRIFRDAAEPDPEDVEYEFSDFRVFEKRGGQTVERSVRSQMFLAAFLEYGVAGISTVRRDGLLFVGPQRLETGFEISRPSVATFDLQNDSSADADFRLVIDGRDPVEFRVAPDATLPVEIDFAPGSHRVAFSVNGDRGGVFLWGAPHLRSKKPAVINPPIILITLDTTRRDAVAPWNANPELTPNLAALSKKSVVFSNAWAASPWTLPSHASIFTGLYPSHHEAGVTKDALPREAVTLAELLRTRGFRTGGFVGGPMAGAGFGLSQGFSIYDDPEGWERSAKGVTDAALTFITANADSPLFVFVNYFDPHEPYNAPERFRQRLAARLDLDDVVSKWTDGAAGANSVVDSDRNVRCEKSVRDTIRKNKMRRAYLEEIAYMDFQIGRLMKGLKRQGLFDRAMIIAVADHGEFLGEGGLFGHSYRLDPELTNVPLLIKWPHQKKAVKVDNLVSHVDLFNTVVSAADLEIPPSDGRSLLLGAIEAPGGRDIVFMEEHASRVHQLVAARKLADHLFGLQWMNRREVLAGKSIECQKLMDETWVDVPCTTGWLERGMLLTDQMRAVASISAPALRNMGTLGGNLCLDTRCTYYNQSEEWRQSIDYCMKEQGETCWVAPSSPRCWAVASGDSAPMLCALDAQVSLQSRQTGTRSIPVADLFRDDGIDYLHKRADEILTAVDLHPKAEAGNCQTSFWKLRRRGAIDFAVLSVGVAIWMSGDTISRARVYLGAVASRPVPAHDCMRILQGQRPEPDLISEAAALARKVATPLDNTDFRAQWRGVMVERYTEAAIREAVGLSTDRLAPRHGMGIARQT